MWKHLKHTGVILKNEAINKNCDDHPVGIVFDPGSVQRDTTRRGAVATKVRVLIN